MMTKSSEAKLNGIGKLRQKEKYDKSEYIKKLGLTLSSKEFFENTGFRLSKELTQSEINQLPINVLVNLVHSMHFPELYEFNKKSFRSEIAPSVAIIEDFDRIKNEKLHFVKGWSKADLTLRAIQGHAQNSHGAFRKYGKFPNTSTLDVVTALQKEEITWREKLIIARNFQERTQETIDNIMRTLEDFFSNWQKYTKPVKLQGSNNIPFAGSTLVSGHLVDMMEFIRGLYFAVSFDTPESRSIVKSQYGHTMGWGSHFIMDMEPLSKYAISLESLALNQYNAELKLLEWLDLEKRLKLMQHLGLIQKEKQDVEDPEFNWSDFKSYYGVNREIQKDKKLQLTYVRYERGHGISDDIAIFLSAFLPQTFTNKNHRESTLAGTSRFLGAFAGDYVDTIHTDSYLLFNGGQDSAIKKYLELKFMQACKDKNFRDQFNIANREDGDYKLVSDSVMTDFIAASGNVNLNGKLEPDIIHSSQRHFNMDHEGTCAISIYSQHLRDEFERLKNKYSPPDKTPKGKINRNVDLTFGKKNSGYICDQMRMRLDLVRTPEMRRGNLENIFKNSN